MAGTDLGVAMSESEDPMPGSSSSFSSDDDDGIEYAPETLREIYHSLEDPKDLEPASAADSGPRPSDADTTREAEDRGTIHARAYQLEMLEKSLRQNIIVAMDTGSGKTQVAVLRIQAELESSSDKIIWFLAPTVTLCEQQFRVLETQIPAAQIKFLSGADNVDTWSEQHIWDDYLKDVRIVVSTYQILLDAITHAFVSLEHLSLIVFDEVHNCVGNNPGVSIMKRYRINKTQGRQSPHILGLTASPIMRSNVDDFEKLEQTLDAVCRSPTTHREELISAVKRPVLSCATYSKPADIIPTDSRKSLLHVFHSLNIYEDPFILSLRAENTERSQAQLEKVLLAKSTFVQKQMKTLCQGSATIHRELGSWASDYYIHKTLTNFIDSWDKNEHWYETWDIQEKQYLAQNLQRARVTPPPPFPERTTEISDKLAILVDELMSAANGTIGIIFAQEISTVRILAHILSEHPSVKSRYRQRNIGELCYETGTLDLEQFRAGNLNLLVATSVLEEGIDVPACNLVVCFDKPANLKSFIQRRGRARMEDSRLLLLLDGSPSRHTEYARLEHEMRLRYEDDMRQARGLAEREDSDQIPDMAPIYSSETGARLDINQAKAHLEHFCNVIASRQYVDPRPYYLVQRSTVEDSLTTTILRATVVLPASLPPHLRRRSSSRAWKSEANACKDAAFQAYKALYSAGLVSENLLPLMSDILEGVETRTSMMEVNDVWDPWPRVAQQLATSTDLQQRTLRLWSKGNVLYEMEASLPCYFPLLPPFHVFWDKDNTWTVEIEEQLKITPVHGTGPDQSSALVDLAYGHRWPVKEGQLVLHLSSTESIAYRQHVGNEPVDMVRANNNRLVRVHHPDVSTKLNHKPYFYAGWLPSRPPIEAVKDFAPEVLDGLDTGPWIALERWPRRVDFLHPVIDQGHIPSTKQYNTVWPASSCTIDTVDKIKAQFGALIPSITHKVKIHLLARELCEGILKDVGFSNMSLVITAISSKAALEPTNYERLEFLGDSILKMMATAYVSVKFPLDPEGYLAARKDSIVSNSRLCRSAVDTGLDNFILTKPFTGKKWRPLYVEDLLQSGPSSPHAKRRVISTKTLADVVESLTGAAYVDGGMPRALACLRLFLPEVEWLGPEASCAILSSRRAPDGADLPATLAPLEDLLGYSFRNKALLKEAVTHSSYSFSSASYGGACNEQLEFLGDAVLDSIVVHALWSNGDDDNDNDDCGGGGGGDGRELSNIEMHLLRCAAVNGDLLGFLTMEWAVVVDGRAGQIAEEETAGSPSSSSPRRLPFWKFMRHSSAEVGRAQRAAAERHRRERDGILEALHNFGSTSSGGVGGGGVGGVSGVSGGVSGGGVGEYPWARLAHLALPKFLSDMFESVLGAVWIDSGGSNDACAAVLERAGLLRCLRRMLAATATTAEGSGFGSGSGSGGFDARHPKNRLGELAARRRLEVRYETVVVRQGGAEEAAAALVCRVYVADALVAEAGGGINRYEVVTRAADLACRSIGGLFTEAGMGDSDTS
ncbi:dicer-like protein 2 [Xylariaceae sp. FL0804]|nr:dicer-like protein 2 [Xylariaceae sp. FL0804]